MSLKVWLPLDGDLRNLGTSNGNFSIKTALTYTDNGKIGKACSGGTITIDANTTASILNNQEFSFTCWVYINSAEGSTSNRGMFFGNSNMGANNNRKFSIFQYPTCNDLHLSWMNDTASTVFIGTIWSGVFPSYKWTHVAVTYKNPNGTIYINGIKYATWSGISNSSSFEYETYLFQNAPDQTRYLNDYRIYDHCLSAAEIHEISQGLVLHYKLNDNINYGENLIPNSLEMQLGTANATTGTWRLAGSNSMTRSRIAIEDTPDGNGYGFQNSGVQTPNDGSCYGIDSFPLEANTPYVISMWGRIIEGTEGYAGFNVYSSTVTGGSWTKIDKNYYVTPLAPSGGWTKCYMSFQTNAATARNIYIGVTTGESSVTTQICNVHIEKGLIADKIVEDSSGYGHNGTINSTISYENSQGGRYSTQAYIGSGTAQSVNTPNILFENMLQGTLNIWINRKSTDTNWRVYTFFANAYNWTGNSHDFLIIGSTGSQRVVLDCCSNTYEFTPDLNKWYMYTISWDLATHTAKMYVNGELKSTKVNDRIDTTYASKHNLHYFGNRTLNNSTYTGDYLLSDARIYCTQLLDNDIKMLYNVGMKVDNLGEVHTFEFEEKAVGAPLNKILYPTNQGVSYAYDKATDTYTLICGDRGSSNNQNLYYPAYNHSKTNYDIETGWGQRYIHTAEFYSSKAITIYIDYNNQAINTDELSGNDNDINRLASSIVLSANVWTRVVFGYSNLNETKNPNHLTLYDYSYIYTTSHTDTFTVKIRNIHTYVINADYNHLQIARKTISYDQFIEDSAHSYASISNKSSALHATNIIET